MTAIFYGALMFTVFLVIVATLAPVICRPSPAARRILEMVQSPRTDRRTIRTKERVQEALLSMATSVRVRFGLVRDNKVMQRLLSAGLKSSRSADAYFASRLLCPIFGMACGSFIHHNTVFWVISLSAVSYLAPDVWLTVKVRKRREAIRKSIPDALDLLVICVDAGLGLDQAMLRVGQELAISRPEINQEFTQINLEQLAGKPRLEAWRSAADRTQVDEFSLFVSMLTQADRFGTPIIRALSRFADEIRQKRRQRAEEKAAKTKIKILFRSCCSFFRVFSLLSSGQQY